jgi:phosphoglycolate phosphatase
VIDLTVLSGATIAFDLDGTLIESAPDLIGAVNAILTSESPQPLAYDEERPFYQSRDQMAAAMGF